MLDLIVILLVLSALALVNLLVQRCASDELSGVQPSLLARRNF